MACLTANPSPTNARCCPSPASTEDVAVELYGWESEGQFWYGPTGLTAARSLRFPALDPACAVCAWKTNERCLDGLSLPLSTTVRDLGDCAVAMVDVSGSCPGPAAIVVAVPQHRRHVMRPELAFEVTAFVRFLEGANTTGSELSIHDQIENVLANERQRSVVFGLCAKGCSGDASIPLSEHIEHLSTAVVDWIRRRDANSRRLSRTRPKLAARF